MIQPNISNRARAGFGLAGCALIAAPFLFDVTGTLRWVLLAVGVMALLEGAIGW